MSIIYNALKKVDKSNEDSSVPGVKTGKKTAFNFKIKPFVFYCFVAGVGFFSASLFFTFIAKRPVKITKPSIASKPAPSKAVEKVNLILQTQDIIPETAVEDKKLPLSSNIGKLIGSAKKPPQKTLTLNGIVFSVDLSYALINNQIVKIGDEIEGMVVAQIEPDCVELRNQDGLFFKLFSDNESLEN